MIRVPLFLAGMFWVAAPDSALGQRADTLRVIVPVVDTTELDRCTVAFPLDSLSPRVPLHLAGATWAFPLGSALIELPSTRSIPGREWANVDTTVWLQVELGPPARRDTGEFLFGPWTSLGTSFYYEDSPAQRWSVGCTHCTDITSRCYTIVDGRLLLMAWGGGPAVSEFTRTNYQSFAAFQVSTNSWLVIWGGGRTPEASDMVRSLIRSVRF